jgi:hypothetical protein
MLELERRAGACIRRMLVLSTTARSALDARALSRLAALTDDLLTVEVPTIERLGGGGVRCMLTEVFSAP